MHIVLYLSLVLSSEANFMSVVPLLDFEKGVKQNGVIADIGGTNGRFALVKPLEVEYESLMIPDQDLTSEVL